MSGDLAPLKTSELPLHFEQQVLASQIRLETVSGGMSFEAVDFNAFQKSRPGKVEDGDGAIRQVNNVLTDRLLEAGGSHSSKKHRFGRTAGGWPGPPGIEDSKDFPGALNSPSALGGNKVSDQRRGREAPSKRAHRPVLPSKMDATTRYPVWFFQAGGKAVKEPAHRGGAEFFTDGFHDKLSRRRGGAARPPLSKG